MMIDVMPFGPPYQAFLCVAEEKSQSWVQCIEVLVLRACGRSGHSPGWKSLTDLMKHCNWYSSRTDKGAWHLIRGLVLSMSRDSDNQPASLSDRNSYELALP